jgi:hypothetical protein
MSFRPTGEILERPKIPPEGPSGCREDDRIIYLVYGQYNETPFLC